MSTKKRLSTKINIKKTILFRFLETNKLKFVPILKHSKLAP